MTRLDNVLETMAQVTITINSREYAVALRRRAGSADYAVVAAA